ncbi:PhzF family phenazine biosynthesis protein [Bacillus sp. KH172YL63]|uniref:PhzF family phenazine biosynthesis protein n=1 Tax=Bacillus sp. KH172YL63 TaxID=2709784 RepID=UPI0013E4662E|nr:PhzF family phenazine biosynthesis protein [Bacillus sp. KH172YL63]BCB03949.1 isomerase [Bacillus sp. KH172YL63]
MKSIHILHYDAFTNIPDKGNPAGVVLNGDKLSDHEMQSIAKKVGFNETAFPLMSGVADIKIRFFTPESEVNLCGHATIAALYALKTRGLLSDKPTLTIETKAGILPITISSGNGDGPLITMAQAKPQLVEYEGSKRILAQSIGLKEEDLHTDYPIMFGSTGKWTLLVPIHSLEAFTSMKPDHTLFPLVLSDIPQASIHPFCLETYDPEAHMHGRHFSAPSSGTTEDPVTGTASAVMGAYYARYIHPHHDGSLDLIVEQGQEIGKDGRVHVHIANHDGSLNVSITGRAVFVKALFV